MKKIFFSIVLFVGVGFAMMGNPAQANDDNGGNDKIGTTVHAVTNTPMAPVHRGRDYIKHEWKVKKNVDFTKMKKTLTVGSWFERHITVTADLDSTSLIYGPGHNTRKPVPIKRPVTPCCKPCSGNPGNSIDPNNAIIRKP